MNPTRLLSAIFCEPWTIFIARVNEFGVFAGMLKKKEVEGALVDQDATPAIESCAPESEGEEGVQEAPKAKQK